MPTLNFQETFVEPIRSRTKKHTIRARGVRTYKVGDKLVLYTGQRTKSCKKISVESVVAIYDVQMFLAEDSVSFDTEIGGLDENFCVIRNEKLDEFSVEDGFENWKALKSWFTEMWSGRKIFTGQIIIWDKDCVVYREMNDVVVSQVSNMIDELRYGSIFANPRNEGITQ